MRAALHGPCPTLTLHASTDPALHGASPDPKQAPIDGADPLKGELELAKGLEQCIVAVRPRPKPPPPPLAQVT